MSKFKVGDKVRYIGGPNNDFFKIGQELTISYIEQFLEIPTSAIVDDYLVCGTEELELISNAQSCEKLELPSFKYEVGFKFKDGVGCELEIIKIIPEFAEYPYAVINVSCQGVNTWAEADIDLLVMENSSWWEPLPGILTFSDIYAPSLYKLSNIMVDLHLPLANRSPYTFNLLSEKVCTCGSAHTSNPSYHLNYCDLKKESINE